jgi:hypothetical protein
MVIERTFDAANDNLMTSEFFDILARW